MVTASAGPETFLMRRAYDARNLFILLSIGETQRVPPKLRTFMYFVDSTPYVWHGGTFRMRLTYTCCVLFEIMHHLRGVLKQNKKQQCLGVPVTFEPP